MTEPESSMAVAEPILEELAQYVVTLRKAGNSYVQIANAVRRKFRFPYFSPEDAHKNCHSGNPRISGASGGRSERYPVAGVGEVG